VANKEKVVEHVKVRAVVEFIFDSHVNDVEVDLLELSNWTGRFVRLDQASSDQTFMGTLSSVTPVEST
jgi:hypothetical protein